MEHVQEYDSICTETELSNSLVCKYLRSQKLDMHSVRNYMQKANILVRIYRKYSMKSLND